MASNDSGPMTRSIFSSFSAAENRVTACFLAVLRSLAVHRIEWILSSLLGDEEFKLVTLEPLPSTEKSGKGQTKPDGRIFSACQILIETKIVPNALREEQLRGHLKQLGAADQESSFLLALTPDTSKPNVIDLMNDRRVRWSSFASLNGAIDDILNDEKDVISEREEFLLREFQKLLADEGVLAPDKNVVVIAAPVGWYTYKTYHCYVGPANRPLRAKYLAFYGKGEIQELVPEILDFQDEVVFRRGLPGEIGKLVDQLLEKAARDPDATKWHEGDTQTFALGEIAKVVLLTAPDDPRTVKLAQPVKNDKKSRSGKNVAFTQWQTYVTLAKLKQAKTTSQLE